MNKPWMHNKIKRFWPLITMLIFPVLGMIYAKVNRPTGRVFSLMTDIDYAIPFVKYFVLPYSIWIFYIYVCLVYFFIKDPRIYFRSLLTYTVCAIICYMIYSVFQTTVPRPTLYGDDVFTKLMRFVYNRDQPFNCFPSIHCFSSYLMMKALHSSSFKNWKNRFFIYGMSSLIILSTLFVKQHAIMDVLSAFLLVEIVYALFTRLDQRVEKPAYSKFLS